MTYAELAKILKKEGWKQKEGKKHPYMVHPDRPGVKLQLGRHWTQEVAKGTLDGILKDAGLK